MAIRGISNGVQYNSQYNVQIHAADEQEKNVIGQQEEEASEVAQLGAQTADSNEAAKDSEQTAKAPAHSDAREFAFDFGSREKFNLVAARNSMEDVDIDRAVSDMKKDTVLNQYNFFVKTAGDSAVNLGRDADGIVSLVSRG